ncbi:MAG: helix-turn-helix domain-containing protein [Puniceicoccales bacterium]|nr:helix-turn-helix domain-containing protein [Puniceicoccales bacterium]
MQYSQDLKNAAVRLAMDGKTYTQASKELRISPQSVRNWHTRFLAVEHCKNKKQPGAKPRVTEEAFTAFHKAYPNAMQKDAAAYFEIRACYHYLFV